jgi:predicted HicB family RNase H-like nuclease
MKNYKGYTARIDYDDSINAFHGRVLGIRDVITFEGTSVAEIEAGFREAVDDYLAWCVEEGRTPEKPCSGRFNLRVDPELHRRAILTAQRRGESLNSFVIHCLDRATRE